MAAATVRLRCFLSVVLFFFAVRASSGAHTALCFVSSFPLCLTCAFRCVLRVFFFRDTPFWCWLSQDEGRSLTDALPACPALPCPVCPPPEICVCAAEVQFEVSPAPRPNYSNAPVWAELTPCMNGDPNDPAIDPSACALPDGSYSRMQPSTSHRVQGSSRELCPAIDENGSPILFKDSGFDPGTSPGFKSALEEHGVAEIELLAAQYGKPGVQLKQEIEVNDTVQAVWTVDARAGQKVELTPVFLGVASSPFMPLRMRHTRKSKSTAARFWTSTRTLIRARPCTRSTGLMTGRRRTKRSMSTRAWSLRRWLHVMPRSIAPTSNSSGKRYGTVMRFPRTRADAMLFSRSSRTGCSTQAIRLRSSPTS